MNILRLSSSFASISNTNSPWLLTFASANPFIFDFSFSTLPPELCISLSQYLTPVDLINLTRMSTAIRKKFIALSWRSIIVSEISRRYLVPPQNQFQRYIPRHCIENPEKYKWLKRQYIVYITLFRSTFQTKKPFSSSICKQYPNLIRITVNTVIKIPIRLVPPASAFLIERPTWISKSSRALYECFCGTFVSTNICNSSFIQKKWDGIIQEYKFFFFLNVS